MFKLKNIFLCLILVFLGLSRPKPVLGRLACIPPEGVDSIPAGYTLYDSGGTFCDVYYSEVVSWDPTCIFNGYTFINQTVYHCKCNLTWMSYRLGADWKVLYAVNSANLWSENKCFEYPWGASTTRTIATDLTACQQYCEVGTPAAWCDASCGTCGVRLNNGTCTNDWGNGTYHLNCCRMECTGCNTCSYVNHSGADLCSAAGQCTAGCPTNTPTRTPTQTPVKVTVSGYVKNSKTGLPVSGARVLVQKTDDKYGFCLGEHWGCSPDYVFTDSTGKWISSCINLPMKSIFVKEVNNATGFVDSSRYPDPAGASVWDKNTVCSQNIGSKTNIGPIVFYDIK